jgi:2'-5' RNA ligase
VRAFLALEIPEEIVSYLKTCVDRLARRTTDVKWVKNEGIHVTVKFLGEIEESFAGSMHDALAPIGGFVAPVETRLGRLDAFPSMRSARVIVVRLSEGGDEMKAIFGEVEERLAALDVEKEKRGFTPHITLGRKRVPKPFPDGDPLPIEERRFTVENLVLFKSTLTPGGAIYAPIWKIKLGGKDR